MKLKSFTAFLLLAFLASCSGSDKAKNESAKEDNVPTVKVEQVSEQDVDQIQTYTATVEPYLINNISAQMSNRIKAIYVDEGMRVSKGQKLVVLDNVNTDSYQLQISTAQAQLSQLEADLNRAKELYRIGGGTRQQDEQMPGCGAGVKADQIACRPQGKAVAVPARCKILVDPLQAFVRKALEHPQNRIAPQAAETADPHRDAAGGKALGQDRALRRNDLLTVEPGSRRVQ